MPKNHHRDSLSPTLKKITIKKRKGVEDLLAIMAWLRGPFGCPWDREQTKKTLNKYLIEEAYEVLEAIEVGTPQDLLGELGDLLLQILFLSRIAEEKGEFTFLDVVHVLAEKLIRRHPHIFSSRFKNRPRPQPRNAQEVIQVWRKVKETEGENTRKKSILDGLPLSLPALEQARKISQRVSRIGFDWPNIQSVWKKVQEELGELKKAERDSIPGSIEEELGDLFFALVNWGRFQGISAEEALRKANRRFTRRFREVESELHRKGLPLAEATLRQLERLWNQAKKKEVKEKSRRRRVNPRSSLRTGGTSPSLPRRRAAAKTPPRRPPSQQPP